ncbi:adenosylcobalamin-dependent ribonucleoside-diphosphate reductase [Hylemonella sp. W303a]|uniref:adenosylcobalamin-dependent ribonucleoside-diphosphate reductase n=1 Tax=Hylemonella sp. W303a TaxID=3389873 RepID=UPI00396B46D0
MADRVQSQPAAPAVTPSPAPGLQAICADVLLEKYAKNDECTCTDVNLRVARALAAAEAPAHRAQWESRFFHALQQGFLPAGRIQSAAGTELTATLINCFVQPIGDAIAHVEEGHPGIYLALLEAAETMRRGGGVGYDFSRIRPLGAWVGSTQSSASGPVSYMRVFDRSCETVESAGSRRGAQMGVLRCDHPDVEAFIHAKDEGDLKNFNISVGVSDAFMQAVIQDTDFELVHRAEPGPVRKNEGAYHDAARGVWVYRKLRARDLWEQIMRSTYDHAEPGVLFIDTINRDNNLSYCETIASTNPCAEQPLPPYGCCCLGSIDLTRFVRHPFEPQACFDFEGMTDLARTAVRMLDNVLDVTMWPLPPQQEEARSKRRVGLGFTGLGDALVMLGLRYDTQPARDMARSIAETLRDTAYDASCELARERGAFPLFNPDLYLSSPRFASRLPQALKEKIRQHGLRNSHLLSVAPTGTISLAFADNASNGIEPAFSWHYTRKKRMPDGTLKEYLVEDHAWRLYRHLKGEDAALTPSFVTALEMSAQDHVAMVAAVAPMIDTAISKTVNVPANYPYADFQDLYLQAWKSGLKGLATYRPNAVLGSVLSAPPATSPLQIVDANRRLALDRLPAPVLSSLRWPGRPELPGGNLAWCFMVRHPHGEFALFVGELPGEEGNAAQAFEVWVNGTEQPRGLGALAKTLSMDLRANDPAWLRLKLDALATVAEERSFDMPFPPHGEKRLFPGVVAAVATVIRWRCEQLGLWRAPALATPVLDAMFAREEPLTGPSGTLAWAVDIDNPATGEAFTLTLKEVSLPGPDGTPVHRPCALGLSGNYPRALDGLARLLSLDMRVLDPAWIGMKLRKLLNYAEPLGHFMAFVPGLPHGERRQQVWPSTVAYIARLIIHRYAMLGILDEAGHPLREMGVLEAPAHRDEPAPLAGRACPECGNATVIRKDGCDFCTTCGDVGQCG